MPTIFDTKITHTHTHSEDGEVTTSHGAQERLHMGIILWIEDGMNVEGTKREEENSRGRKWPETPAPATWGWAHSEVVLSRARGLWWEHIPEGPGCQAEELRFSSAVQLVGSHLRSSREKTYDQRCGAIWIEQLWSCLRSFLEWGRISMCV